MIQFWFFGQQARPLPTIKGLTRAQMATYLATSTMVLYKADAVMAPRTSTKSVIMSRAVTTTALATRSTTKAAMAGRVTKATTPARITKSTFDARPTTLAGLS